MAEAGNAAKIVLTGNDRLGEHAMNMQIPVSPDLKSKIEREASARGMSMHDFVRQLLERAVASSASDDPLFADQAVFRDDGPTDAAANHDDYLYGDAS